MRTSTSALAGFLTTGALLAACLPASAQTVDRSFRPLDVRVYSLADNAGTAIEADGQGRWVVAGRFDALGGRRCGNVARLLADGALDPTFNGGGSGADGPVERLVALAGGKWLIQGQFLSYNGAPVNGLARLLPDGALDPSFHGPTQVSLRRVFVVAADSRGRVLLAFQTTQGVGPWSTSQTHLLRLRPDGSADTTFQLPAALAPTFDPYLLALDTADRVIISATSLQRLLPTGAIDTTFYDYHQPPLPTDAARVQVLHDGRLLLFNYHDHLTRRLPDGTPDTTFVTPAYGRFVWAATETPTGELLLTGAPLVNQGPIDGDQVMRLLPSGALDPTFNSPALYPQFLNRRVNALAVDAVGRVLLAGNFAGMDRRPVHGWLPRTGFARLTATGVADSTFANPGLQRLSAVLKVLRQSDDRLLVLVADSDHWTPAEGRLRRLLPDGAPDPTWQPDWTLATAWLEPDAVRLDGTDRLVVKMPTGIRRYLPTGARDTLAFSGIGEAVAAYPDGRLIVANGVDLFRLLADGRTDTTFAFQSPGGQPWQVAVCPDGSVLAVYDNGMFGNTLYWLDAAGQPLPASGTGIHYGLLTVLPDTSVLLDFQTRLTRAGTVDSAFSVDPQLYEPGFDMPSILQLLPQPDGYLLALVAKNAPARPELRRLLPTGALDPAFAPVEFGSDAPLTLVQQSDGRIIVGGRFSTAGGLDYPSLARVTNVITGTPAPLPVTPLGLFPNPAHDHFTLCRPTADAATATLLDVLGRPVRQWALTAADTRLSVAGVPVGAYVVRVVGAAGVLTRRVVVE